MRSGFVLFCIFIMLVGNLLLFLFEGYCQSARVSLKVLGWYTAKEIENDTLIINTNYPVVILNDKRVR